MTDYTIETIDSRKDYHKCKEIKDVVNFEKTYKHYLFTKKKGTVQKLRTDTWKDPIKKKQNKK